MLSTVPIKRQKSNWSALIVVMSGVFLSTMDSGMVNIAIPTIMRYFSLPLEVVERIVTVYLLTITITLVFWGRIADRIGLERVYLSGLFVFSFGAVLCYCSKNFSYLLFSRLVQGFGASMMMASGPALIKSSFPDGQLGRNLGLVGIATACGLLTGPFICGNLLAHFSWRSIYVLLGMMSFVIGCCGITLFIGGFKTTKKIKSSAFDWQGGFCWVAIVLLFINLLHTVNLLPPVIILIKILILAGLVTFFIHVEGRAKHPILPLKIFARRYFWVATVTSSLSFASLFSVLVLIPFYLDYIQQMTSREIGLMMMAVPGTLILLSPTAGFLYDKIGARFLTSFGLLVSCLSLFGLSQLTVDSSNLVIFLLLAAMGAGQSIFLSPNSASVLSKVANDRLGATSGILATARNFGMVFGATVSTVLFTYFSFGRSVGLDNMNLEQLGSALFMLALGATFKCIAGLSCLACVISTLRD